VEEKAADVRFTPEDHEGTTEILEEHYHELLRELSRGAAHGHHSEIIAECGSGAKSVQILAT